MSETTVSALGILSVGIEDIGGIQVTSGYGSDAGRLYHMHHSKRYDLFTHGPRQCKPNYSTFARESGEELVCALISARTDKAVGKDALEMLGS